MKSNEGKGRYICKKVLIGGFNRYAEVCKEGVVGKNRISATCDKAERAAWVRNG